MYRTPLIPPEEEAARAKDPVVREQLQTLINQRRDQKKQRNEKLLHGIGSTGRVLSENTSEVLTETPRVALILGAITLGVFRLILLLAWLLGTL